MSLVVIGSVAYDAIETPHGKRERALGGACTYISLSASYFTKPSIVGVVGEDFATEDRELLASKGVDLEGLEQVPGKTFFWSGVYSDDMNDRTTRRTDLNVFADFQPKLPASYVNAPYLFLGNIQPTLQRDVYQQMKKLRFVGGDTMNYWIADHQKDLLATIKDWDFLLINDGEARMLAQENNLRKAAQKILDLGPRTLVIKRGEYGATIFFRDGFAGGGNHPFRAPALPIEEVVDPTGAGDSFAGGFMGYVARTGDLSDAGLRRAVVYGSAMGSFAVERFSVQRLLEITPADIASRVADFRRLVAFEEERPA